MAMHTIEVQPLPLRALVPRGPPVELGDIIVVLIYGLFLGLQIYMWAWWQKRGKKKAEVQAIVARLSPQPDVPFSVRRVADRSHLTCAAGEGAVATESASETPAILPPMPGGSAVTDHVGLGTGPTGSATEATVTGSAGQPSLAPASVILLSADRYKLQLTIGGETLEKLRLSQDMLAHAEPSGDPALVIDRALTTLLVELAKRKFAGTLKPRGTREKEPETRNRSRKVRKPDPPGVPAAVKRVVWVRDLGRCAFVGIGGHRCNERRFVEFHHVDPHGLGGEATVDGIQLRCRRHNDYEGRLYFGRRRRRELVPEQVRLSASRSHPEDGPTTAADGTTR